MSGAIPPLPNTPPWRGAQLKHRDNFTFTIEITHSNTEKIIHVSRVNFSKHHKNVTKHTNPLEVDILIRNKFMAILEATGRILTIEYEKIVYHHGCVGT
jgi:hypothetical protein